MKKKILAIALAVALLAIVVSGSLAYFTAQDKVTNTFTVGSVKIEIYENEEATEEDVIEFGKLVPVVNTADPAADESYLEKVVDVKNIGNNDAYIRTHIAIPTALVGYLHLDLTETGWVRQADSAATVDGVAYTVYTWDHTAAVTSDSFTNELLQGVYLGADVDLEENAEGNLVFILRDSAGKKIADSGFVAHTKTANGYTSATVNVLVASQAIQSAGFTGATAALNSGFAANPWA